MSDNFSFQAEAYLATYIINQSIVFNDDDGTLGFITDEDPVHTLPLPAKWLLSYLISHPGVDLSREAILVNVWEINNKIPSNNNLNHYMSILRTALGQLDQPGIITTIPKMGFRFDASVEIIRGPDHEVQAYDNAGTVTVEQAEIPSVSISNGDINHNIDIFNTNTLPSKNNYYFYSGTLLLILVVAFFWMLSYYDYSHRMKTTQLTLLARHDLCTVYSLPDSDIHDDMNTLSLVNFLELEYSLDCKRSSVIYLSTRTIKLDGYNTVSRFSYFCPGSDIPAAGCINVKSETRRKQGQTNATFR